MEKVKKIIFFSIPMSICNFRCHYCYLAQRDEHYQGIQPEMRFSSAEVGYALRPERIGGLAYFNFCADGETLLVKDIDLYVKSLVKYGHYAEIITNMSITKTLDKFLEWPKELLSHIEFKCSLHYQELKAKNLLEVFSNNVRRAREAGASISVEITPTDELIPYIDEVKEYSLKSFGAFPHLTIARNDRTENIEYLTKLPMEQYDKIWSSFDSDFWYFKKSIFGIKQTEFCYAGLWSAYVNLCTGEARQCYCGRGIGNVFEHPNAPFPGSPIGKCQIAHCYNGHAFLSWGLIPGANDVYYSALRNRICEDGTEWLQPELKDFFSSKLEESNEILTEGKKSKYVALGVIYEVLRSKKRQLQYFLEKK